MTSLLFRSGLLIPKQFIYPIFNNPVRCAGHAKWQNIKNTKQANDLAKGKLISRYVMLVRRAIVSNAMKTDPKLNPKLAAVLNEANKLNVPKATLERAIARTANIQIKSINIEIQGPMGCSIIARCETDNKNFLRRELKKAIKKFDAAILPEETVINMFKPQGFIRASMKSKDGQVVDRDRAEEAAIMADAQDVDLEINEDALDENYAKVWVFSADAERLNQCRGELERLGIDVISADSELVPYRYINFGDEVVEKVVELQKVLTELDQVVDVHHNVEIPK